MLFKPSLNRNKNQVILILKYDYDNTLKHFFDWRKSCEPTVLL